MRRIAIFLALSVLFAAGLPGGTAQAQSLANKQLCEGSGSQASCDTASNPQIGDVLHYRFELANGPAANTLLLTEDYPAAFTPANATSPVSCRDTSGTPLTVTVVAGGPPLQFSVAMPANGDAICVMDGSFTQAGGVAKNTVTLDGQTFSPSVNTVISPDTELDLDLEITKTIAPPTLVPMNISGGPQTARYRIEITTDKPVYLGEFLQVFDQLALFPNGVGVDAALIPTSVECELEQGGTIVGVAGCGLASNLNAPVSSPAWQDFASFGLAPGTLVLLEPGGKLVIEYEVTYSVPVDASCVRQADSEGVRNRAFLGLAGSTQALRDDNDDNNDTVGNSASDLPLITGIEYVDPDCGGGGGGGGPSSPLLIEKTLTKINGQPVGSNPVIQWGDTATFKIRLTNPGAPAINVESMQIRDELQNRPGTPNFEAQVTAMRVITCNNPAACARSHPGYFGGGPVVPFTSYYDQHFMAGYIAGNLTNPHLEFEVDLKLDNPTCDYSPSIGPKTVRNWVRVKHKTRRDDGSGGLLITDHVSASYVDVEMAAPPACAVSVRKESLPGSSSTEVTDPAHVDFNKWKKYRITFSTPPSGGPGQPGVYKIGTLVDAVRLVQPTYAAGLKVDYSWSCVDPSGTRVRNFVPSATGSATTSYVGGPHQGVRIMDHPGFVEFDANAQLVCDVAVLVHPPAPTDPYCFSDGTPQLENFALMDGSLYFNANNPWPTSPQGNTWDAVRAELPRCINIVINKTASPSVVPPTGGPITYTIDIINPNRPGTDGDINFPVGTFPSNFGSSGPGNFTGVILEDDFVTGPPGAAMPLGSLSVPPSNPCLPQGQAPCDTTLGSQGERLIGVTTLPAGSSISYTYQLSGPFAPDQLCNHVEAGFFIDGREQMNRWYPKNPSTWEATTCTPIRSTLEVRKSFVTPPWVTLPGNTQFVIDVECDVPSGFNDVNMNLLVTPANSVSAIGRLPIGSECKIEETNLPDPDQFGDCSWDSVQYPLGDEILIDGSVEPHFLEVVNTLQCAPQQGGTPDLEIAKELVSDADCMFTTRLCTFRITVTNSGDGWFSGPVSLTDTFTNPNNSSGAFYDLGQVDPFTWDWACQQGAMSTPITCTEPQLDLAPSGGSSYFEITLDMFEEGVNCVVLDDPLYSPPKEACVPVGGYVEQADTSTLEMEKALKPGACPGKAVGSGLCTFIITISNTGSADVSGLVSFQDVITGGAAGAGGILSASAIPADWICTASGAVTECSNPNAFIGANQSITIELTLDFGFAAPVGENCLAWTEADAAAMAWEDCVPLFSQDQPALELVKTKITPSPCQLGVSECIFRFTITNTGTGAHNGPLTFQDQFFALGGTVQPGILAITVNGQASTGWTCTYDATSGTFTCTNPLVNIPAGQTYIVDIRFDYGPGFSARWNCARLVGANGNGPDSCVPSTGVEVTKRVISCDFSQINGPCLFRILVTSTGMMNYTGPITVTDDFRFLNSTTPPNLISAGGNGWVCSGSGGQVTCTHPGPVFTSGNTSSFDVVLGSNAAIGAIENCAEVTATPNLVSNTSCVQTSYGPPPPAPTLSITKELVDPENCSAAMQSCRFRITVTHTGGGGYNGPLTVDDISQFLTAGQATFIISAGGNGWTCTPGSSGATSCTHPGPVFANGNTSSFDVVLESIPPIGDMENCASITSPAGLAAGPSCAQTDGSQPVVNQPPGMQLSILKENLSDPVVCNYLGPKQCKFRITVTNTGTTPYTGPLSLDDVYSSTQNGAVFPTTVAVQASNGWSCGTATGSVAGQACSIPVVTLNPGDVHWFEVTLGLAGTPGVYTQNCAKLTNPAQATLPESCVELGQQTGQPQQPEQKKKPGFRIRIGVGGILGGGKKGRREQPRGGDRPQGEQRGDR
ncbi:DUF5979 domain-containing protein [Paraurantiacibacter namhicola]|uniref:DUF5979 domain-containing protein n=1 Tax=Paraurantiacibacter namhicola TaxID=645517 RepID=A0A1C7D818_9SPHN|nr:DUF5979 domain-containing protein [Paraurantiacibacter namhicola]ANU07433.1 hypothetical protein A6F65_01125 [Paraurantiacibacter namhicola]